MAGLESHYCMIKKHCILNLIIINVGILRVSAPSGLFSQSHHIYVLNVHSAIILLPVLISHLKAATLGDHFSPADPSVITHLDHVMCIGDEVSISECSYQKRNQSYYRPHSQNAGVICAGKLTSILCWYTILSIICTCHKL